MNLTKILKSLLILLIPIMLSAEPVAEQPIELIQEKKVISEKKEIAVTPQVQMSGIEKQIEAQNKFLDELITEINHKIIKETTLTQQEFNKQVNYLTNKININKIEKNILAVKRDEVKRDFLKQRHEYELTIKNIILAKEEFKDKKYFDNIILQNIKNIEENSIDKYTKVYDVESKNDNTISNTFTKNYIELFNQKHTQVFTLKYLYNNMTLYRKSNFIIDEFNLQYLVKKIDSIYGISFISGLTSYYLKFSVGEIVVVLFIMLVFRLLNLTIISLIANFISRIFVKRNSEDSEAIREYLRRSIDTPLKYALYLLGIQISLYILINDDDLLNKIIPWINTTYIALLTWGLYAVLNNSINIYAHTLLEKYPNVRKEMIAFILRIIKIILILLVILFLFMQLGIDIKAIAASLGVGGIAIALASKDTLANFFSSLNIMTDNSFSQGDWIKTSEVEGTVVDIRMRTTRIRTFDNAMITVPNTQLANTPIINWSKRKVGRRIKMTLGITYDSKMEDIVQLKKDIFNMLDTHPEIASMKNAENKKSRHFEAIKKEDLEGIKRTLLVYVDSYGDSSINILVYCFTRNPGWESWLTTKEDVLIQLSKLVKKNNCDFAFPTQTLFVKSESEVMS
jgi:MscS family membrane protein